MMGGMPTKTIRVETVAQAYLELLRERGIDCFFGNAGTDFASIVDVFAKLAVEGKVTCWRTPGDAPAPPSRHEAGPGRPRRARQRLHGRAVVDCPERRARLAIEAGPPRDHLVVYTPPGRAFFCVEPVSHVTDAFNLAAAGRTDTGTLVLTPSETVKAWVRLTPEAA
jgi:hypothetical protein